MENILVQVRTTLNFRLFNLAGTPVTLATIVTFLLIMLGGWLLARLVRRAILRGFRSRGVTDEGTIGVTTRLVHYSLFVVALGIGLQTIGIKLSALFAAGAVFAVAVGFAMQTMVQNFVSGVILLMERSIKPNDILLVDNTLIRVVKLGIRTTVARTRDEEDLIVPNSKLVQATVKNYTFRDRLYRIRNVVGVVYRSNMKTVRMVLEEVARKFSERDSEHEPVVLLKNFGNSSVDWEVSVWTRDPWNFYPLQCALNEAMWNGLKEAGIVIAFPQVDVHFDPVVEDTIASWEKAA